jgi:hypothetical protein
MEMPGTKVIKSCNKSLLVEDFPIISLPRKLAVHNNITLLSEAGIASSPPASKKLAAISNNHKCQRL